MSVTLTTAQFVEGFLTPVDSEGQAALVEPGSVMFLSSDETIFSVEKNPDNELAFKITANAAGVAQLDFSADADLGDGVKTISGFAAIEVIPSEAVGFGIVFGEPQNS